MKGQFNKENVTAMLLQKYEELRTSGEGRFPQRSDFTEEEVCAVKAFFGPWPRALEAVGIKAPRAPKGMSNAEKRILKKRKRRAMEQENGQEDTRRVEGLSGNHDEEEIS